MYPNELRQLKKGDKVKIIRNSTPYPLDTVITIGVIYKGTEPYIRVAKHSDKIYCEEIETVCGPTK